MMWASSDYQTHQRSRLGPGIIISNLYASAINSTMLDNYIVNVISPFQRTSQNMEFFVKNFNAQVPTLAHLLGKILSN